MNGSRRPCPRMVSRTDAVVMKMISVRIGKGCPLSITAGRLMAIARDTIPRIPDQLIITPS